MAISDLPVLPSTHPLFDWTNYQSSKDALVPGTSTRLFAKEAWNAIVDSLNNALTAAGLSWDNKYTTAEGAKITESPAQLTAQKFNSVSHNIDLPVSLGWQWAFNPDFRGYVGRENFYGQSTHGASADQVYAAYILELVRRLNVMIEVMRGTATVPEVSVQYDNEVAADANLQAGAASAVSLLWTSGISSDTVFEALPPAPIAVDQILKLQTATIAMERLVSTALASEVNQHADIDTQAYAKPTLTLVPQPASASSYATADSVAKLALKVDVNMATATQSVSASMLAIPKAKLVDVVVYAASAVVSAQSQLTAGISASFATQPQSAKSTVSASVQSDRSKELTVDSRARASSDTVVDTTQQIKFVEVELNCKTDIVRTLDNDGWLVPLRWNDGLWIRQAHTITQREDGSLEVI